MHVPPLLKTTCVAFDEYEDVPKMVPLNLMHDDVMCAASNLSGAAGVLEAEVIDLCNRIICFL